MFELRGKQHMSRQDATSSFPPIIALCAFKHLRSTNYFDTPRHESQVESPSLTLFEAQLCSKPGRPSCPPGQLINGLRGVFVTTVLDQPGIILPVPWLTTLNAPAVGSAELCSLPLPHWVPDGVG